MTKKLLLHQRKIPIDPDTNIKERGEGLGWRVVRLGGAVGVGGDGGVGGGAPHKVAFSPCLISNCNYSGSH